MRIRRRGNYANTVHISKNLKNIVKTIKKQCRLPLGLLSSFLFLFHLYSHSLDLCYPCWDRQGFLLVNSLQKLWQHTKGSLTDPIQSTMEIKHYNHFLERGVLCLLIKTYVVFLTFFTKMILIQ